ncbi:MAG: ABC transporter ATP-binding protein [Rhodobacteraceae bacterium]|nr:MAG: ABC transporter ATP-binding protein [Paracoccaceae bacterium]
MLLEISNLKARYGDVEALKSIELRVKKGEITCLLGKNGMGKSTIIKCVCGMLKTMTGEINFEGNDIVGLQSHKIARLGVGLVPEGRRIFTSLTVQENLICSARKGYWSLKKIFDLFPILGERVAQSALTLSGGEQQMLAIGRALMTNPILLILDEATEGLSPIVSGQVWEVLKKISDEGVTILIIDKLSSRLKSLSNSGFIVEKGETVWTGEMTGLSNSIARKYLSV